MLWPRGYQQEFIEYVFEIYSYSYRTVSAFQYKRQQQQQQQTYEEVYREREKKSSKMRVFSWDLVKVAAHHI